MLGGFDEVGLAFYQVFDFGLHVGSIHAFLELLHVFGLEHVCEWEPDEVDSDQLGFGGIPDLLFVDEDFNGRRVPLEKPESNLRELLDLLFLFRVIFLLPPAFSPGLPTLRALLSTTLILPLALFHIIFSSRNRGLRYFC